MRYHRGLQRQSDRNMTDDNHSPWLSNYPLCDNDDQTAGLTSPISTNPNNLILEPKLFEPDMSIPCSHHHRGSCTQSNRRSHDSMTHYPVPLRDCLLSCELDRRNASVSRDRFEVFQDAVHMANLLDPLSKFSVTPQSDNIESPTASKRSRLTHLFQLSELEPTSQHQPSSS
ncbi:hypothetical protein EG68_06701 [Paragonimus skrjabini miyazakii]|uniref:Uncharacterized protein n=1 Tax=Paragonimus skrjabini miyazakii TaxID=59628 RepID=A0A8S9YJJ0_9TREM|nr:hypothetical protein EG68_06701 [Paragonimus skrjabini miyazakii]